MRSCSTSSSVGSATAPMGGRSRETSPTRSYGLNGFIVRHGTTTYGSEVARQSPSARYTCAPTPFISAPNLFVSAGCSTVRLGQFDGKTRRRTGRQRTTRRLWVPQGDTDRGDGSKGGILLVPRHRNLCLFWRCLDRRERAFRGRWLL